MSEKNLFEKIIDREIPANIVYEDELSLAFTDINPQAPVHILVIPKKCIAGMQDITEEDKGLIGHLFCVIRLLAEQHHLLETGYRVVSNNGLHAGQTVPHLHYHLLGGRYLDWPPG
ncbi:MAG: histidine triad nucleotide-binding protein [Thermoguttaceae bacterium]